MKRIFHISNRVEIPETGKPTAGGLDEAIADTPEGYTNVRFGWSGKTVSDNIDDMAATIQIIKKGDTTYITYDMRESDLKAFYSNVANGVIWPANHYRDDIAKDGFEQKYLRNGVEHTIWDDIDTYYRVNETVAKLAEKYIHANDTVIVHDYHFIPLGSYLNPEIAVGYFHHTPVLNADFLETLDRPQQEFFQKLFENLYCYDFVGVQTKNDLRALHSLIAKTAAPAERDFFETQNFSNQHERNGKHTRFGAFPVAGNAPKYTQLAKEWENRPEVLNYIKQNPGGVMDLMSVERRDYSKGIVPKVNAVGRWLHAFGQRGERIHLTQVAPKGREEVKAYQEESLKIETAVESVRIIFGDIVRLEGGKVERGKHLGLARHASAALVTPTRDGMNLYVPEFLAAQIGRDDPAVAIVSKFAGISSIYNGALISVDPRKPDSIAHGIQVARTMTRQEKQDMIGRVQGLQEFFTNTRWQTSLIEATENAARPKPSF